MNTFCNPPRAFSTSAQSESPFKPPMTQSIADLIVFATGLIISPICFMAVVKNPPFLIASSKETSQSPILAVISSNPSPIPGSSPMIGLMNVENAEDISCLPMSTNAKTPFKERLILSITSSNFFV